MAITSVTIENFKGIRDPVRVELKPITLLFGPNSAGKSTVVQALHYGREIFERHNLNPDRTQLGGSSIDLGGFENLVHQHDLALPIRLRFDLDLSRDDLPRYFEAYAELYTDWREETELDQLPNTVKSAWVEITLQWNRTVGSVLLSSYKVGVNDEELATIETSEDGRQINLTRLAPFNPVFLGDAPKEAAQESTVKLVNGENLSGDEIEALGAVFLRFFDHFNTDEGVPGLTKNIPLDNQKSALPQWGMPLRISRSIWEEVLDSQSEADFTEVLSSLIVGPGELIRDALRNLCYVGPLREVPRRGHRPSMTPDASRWANGLGAYDKLFNGDGEFINRVNHWLSSDQRLNSGYNLEVKKYRELEDDNPLMLALQQDRLLDEDIDFRKGILALPIKRRLLIRDEARNMELEPQDIGVGISQMLPVVVAALGHKVGIVAIEQPELHIHPALQVALGDLFIEQVQASPDMIFILETHSEHLLLRLMRRIRETYSSSMNYQEFPLRHDQLGVWFVELLEERTVVREMPVNEYGELIKAWPGGFFEEGLGEVF
ncbi:MAG: AAA family ATPase [Desulfuromusa sp.]